MSLLKRIGATTPGNTDNSPPSFRPGARQEALDRSAGQSTMNAQSLDCHAVPGPRAAHRSVCQVIEWEGLLWRRPSRSQC